MFIFKLPETYHRLPEGCFAQFWNIFKAERIVHIRRRYQVDIQDGGQIEAKKKHAKVIYYDLFPGQR